MSNGAFSYYVDMLGKTMIVADFSKSTIYFIPFRGVYIYLNIKEEKLDFGEEELLSYTGEYQLVTEIKSLVKEEHINRCYHSNVHPYSDYFIDYIS